MGGYTPFSYSNNNYKSNFHLVTYYYVTRHCRYSLSNPAAAAATVAKSLQSCLTLCNSRDDSPPRLPRPWDSPGKNTGVGCHCLLQILMS